MSIIQTVFMIFIKIYRHCRFFFTHLCYYFPDWLKWTEICRCIHGHLLCPPTKHLLLIGHVWLVIARGLNPLRGFLFVSYHFTPRLLWQLWSPYAVILDFVLPPLQSILRAQNNSLYQWNRVVLNSRVGFILLFKL